MTKHKFFSPLTMNLTPFPLQVTILNSTNQVTCESYAAVINDKIMDMYTHNPFSVLYPNFGFVFMLFVLCEVLYVVVYLIAKHLNKVRILEQLPMGMLFLRLILVLAMAYTIL